MTLVAFQDGWFVHTLTGQIGGMLGPSNPACVPVGLVADVVDTDNTSNAISAKIFLLFKVASKSLF
jgi:hypothetical protein